LETLGHHRFIIAGEWVQHKPNAVRDLNTKRRRFLNGSASFFRIVLLLLPHCLLLIFQEGGISIFVAIYMCLLSLCFDSWEWQTWHCGSWASIYAGCCLFMG